MPTPKPVPAAADQRTRQRYALALPITMEGEEGLTHDLSADGILFEARRRPALGARVALSLQYRADDAECRLRCDGEVVRVERHGDGFNIAVKLSRPLFR